MSWLPTDLGASLALWLDATDADTVILRTDTDFVETWNDKSGNNNNVTQPEATRQPEYTALAIDGNTAVTFDGSNDSLDGSLAQTAFSIGMVATLTDNTFTAYYPIGFGGTTGILTGGTVVSQKAGMFNGSTVLSANESVPLNTPYLLTANGNASGRGISLNGQPQATDANAQNITGFRLGRRSNDFGPTPGPMGEIVITDTVLSVSDRQKLEGYLAWKWGGVPETRLWTPYDLGTSLALWLDAEDTDTITLNGSSVSQWNDKSGNGIDFSQASAAWQPNYTPVGIGGKPSLTFTDQKSLTNASWTLPSDNRSVFIVAHPTDVAQNVSYILDIELGRHLFLGSGQVFSGTFEPTADPISTPVERVYGFVTGPSNLFVYSDGNLLSSSGAASSVAVGGTIAVGSRFSKSISFYQGEISEIVFVNGAIATDDRQKLEGYLAWKWGLEGNLPAGHPYKSAPPTVEVY